MICKWEEMQAERPELADIIQKGLDKLGSYQERLERVPAYVLAMRMSTTQQHYVSYYYSSHQSGHKTSLVQQV